MTQELADLIKPQYGKKCCRQRVWRGRSLSLGFGEKTYHGNAKLVDPYYGEWEMGTYYGAWRVLKEGMVVCGSDDAVESVGELDALIKRIKFGAVLSLAQITEFDVRVVLDNEIAVDFLTTANDEEETFHIFCPGSVYVEFSNRKGWSVGHSGSPTQEPET